MDRWEKQEAVMDRYQWHIRDWPGRFLLFPGFEEIEGALIHAVDRVPSF
jgi:hypothetical protein